MHLRIYQTYDKNGVESKEALQYWDEDYGEWTDVPFVREREDEVCRECGELLTKHFNSDCPETRYRNFGEGE